MQWGSILWLTCLMIPGCSPRPVAPASNAAAAPQVEVTFLGEATLGCHSDPAQRPYVVDWQSHEREELTARARQGAVVVLRAGCDLQVLERCKAPPRFAYRYEGSVPDTDTITFRNLQQTHDLIPVHADDFDHRFAHGGAIHAATTLAGMYRIQRRLVSYDELQGECQGATHLISAISVGAFSLYTDVVTPIVPESEAAGGIGVETLNAGGNPKACRGSAPVDSAPPGTCDCPVRLELAAIASTGLKCKPGEHLLEGECKPMETPSELVLRFT